MNLDNLIGLLDYPPNIEQAVRSEIENNEEAIGRIAETAYTGEDFDFALLKYDPEICLTVVTYLLADQYHVYKAKGVPDTIIMDTFRDVTLRAKLYYQKNGKAGITQDDVLWFRHIMNGNIFKIGPLQYQAFEMIYLDEETIGEPYMEFSESQKRSLPAGSPVINIHIPHGADLNNALVSASLDGAKKLLAALFPHTRYNAFLCYSWLLYPPMVNCLSEKSNIRQFAERFHIIGACDDSEQALENLQGDRETKLVKMVKNHEHLLGFACGVMKLDT